jgi:predicted nucleic acid-binding protein
MTTKQQLVSWDSCVVISYLHELPGRLPSIAPMITQAESGDLIIVVSEIVVAELVKLDNLAEQGVGLTEQQSVIEDFFERRYIVPRIVDRGVSKLAARLQANYEQLKTCDAVILATAIHHDVDIVYTYDGYRDDGSVCQGLSHLDGIIPTRATGQYLEIKPPSGRTDGQFDMQMVEK